MLAPRGESDEGRDGQEHEGERHDVGLEGGDPVAGEPPPEPRGREDEREPAEVMPGRAGGEQPLAIDREEEDRDGGDQQHQPGEPVIRTHRRYDGGDADEGDAELARPARRARRPQERDGQGARGGEQGGRDGDDRGDELGQPEEAHEGAEREVERGRCGDRGDDPLRAHRPVAAQREPEHECDEEHERGGEVRAVLGQQEGLPVPRGQGGHEHGREREREGGCRAGDPELHPSVGRARETGGDRRTEKHDDGGDRREHEVVGEPHGETAAVVEIELVRDRADGEQGDADAGPEEGGLRAGSPDERTRGHEEPDDDERADPPGRGRRPAQSVTEEGGGDHRGKECGPVACRPFSAPQKKERGEAYDGQEHPGAELEPQEVEGRDREHEDDSRPPGDHGSTGRQRTADPPGEGGQDADYGEGEDRPLPADPLYRHGVGDGEAPEIPDARAGRLEHPAEGDEQGGEQRDPGDGARADGRGGRERAELRARHPSEAELEKQRDDRRRDGRGDEAGVLVAAAEDREPDGGCRGEPGE